MNTYKTWSSFSRLLGIWDTSFSCIFLRDLSSRRACLLEKGIVLVLLLQLHAQPLPCFDTLSSLNSPQKPSLQTLRVVTCWFMGWSYLTAGLAECFRELVIGGIGLLPLQVSCRWVWDWSLPQCLMPVLCIWEELLQRCWGSVLCSVLWDTQWNLLFVVTETCSFHSVARFVRFPWCLICESSGTALFWELRLLHSWALPGNLVTRAPRFVSVERLYPDSM